MDKLEQLEEWSERYLAQVNEMVGGLKKFLQDTGALENVEPGKWYRFSCDLMFSGEGVLVDALSLKRSPDISSERR